jgi:hypothetical protein
MYVHIHTYIHTYPQAVHAYTQLGPSVVYDAYTCMHAYIHTYTLGPSVYMYDEHIMEQAMAKLAYINTYIHTYAQLGPSVVYDAQAMAKLAREAGGGSEGLMESLSQKYKVCVCVCVCFIHIHMYTVGDPKV